MNKFINMAEKAFYIVLVTLGAVFFLTAFLGSSMLNMITRVILGGAISVCGLLELVPEFFKFNFKRRKRRVTDETGLTKTSRIQRDQIKIRQR
jgi:hypothetical protein